MCVGGISIYLSISIYVHIYRFLWVYACMYACAYGGRKSVPGFFLWPLYTLVSKTVSCWACSSLVGHAGWLANELQKSSSSHSYHPLHPALGFGVQAILLALTGSWDPNSIPHAYMAGTNWLSRCPISSLPFIACTFCVQSKRTLTNSRSWGCSLTFYSKRFVRV